MRANAGPAAIETGPQANSGDTRFRAFGERCHIGVIGRRFAVLGSLHGTPYSERLPMPGDQLSCHIQAFKVASERRQPQRARLRLAAVLSMLLLAQPGLVSAWETVLNSDNLRVERRPYGGSALNEIRGVTRIRASLNALMALLKDADYNQHWVYRSGGATILQENGYGQAYVYGIVDAPWPMSDRDTIVRFDYHQDPSTQDITITISNFPEFAGDQPGLIRVPDFGGFWQLKPQHNGWVEVIYQVYGDPGGYVPVWLANYAAAVSVIRTLQNMPAAVTRYANARSQWVDEFSPR